jgi:hypothetical protein
MSHSQTVPTRSDADHTTETRQLPLISHPPKTRGDTHTSRTTSNARQLKSLNLNTYKVHALGDYALAIRSYGTTDSYSTETVNTFNISPNRSYIAATGRIGASMRQIEIYTYQSKGFHAPIGTDGASGGAYSTYP